MELTVTNPYDQSIVCTLPYADDSVIQSTLEHAQNSQRHWQQLSVAERCERVQDGLAYFNTHADVIARDITQQMGKPITESHNELKGFFERAEYMLGIAEEALAPDVLPAKPGFTRRIEHVPHGVVFNIGAWNYPLLIPVNVIVPALLAGNTVILKHSAKTPLIGEHFAKAFGEDLVQHLILEHEQTARLIQQPSINHVAFTGSVTGGYAIQKAVAHRFIDAGLELGGKDAAYVAADADIDFAVSNIIEGACYNAGQSCCGVERIYVHDRVYDDFIAKAEQVIQDYQPGDPMQAATTLGPLASRAALVFLEQQVNDAVAKGAQCLTGGERINQSEANFFPATLLANVSDDADVMQSESFGPLAPVQAVANDDEAIRKINNSRYGLTASVWTQDDALAERCATNINAGTIFQNRCDYLDPALPWTGYNDSGKGSTLSKYGFYHLTKRKSIHFREDINQ